MDEIIPTATIFDYIDKNAARFQVDPALAKQIFLGENLLRTASGEYQIPTSVNSKTTSPKGAIGVMQVMPSTHTGLVNQGYLPPTHTLEKWTDQVDAGLAALKAKQRQHRTTDPVIIAAAYNGGNDAATAVKEGRMDALPAETRGYLQKISTAQTFLGIKPANVPQLSETSRPRPTTDPIAKGIEAYQATLADHSKIFAELTKAITTTTDQAVAAKVKEAGELRAAGEAQAATAAITGTIDAAAATTRTRIANLLNLNTENANNLISNELTRQAALEQELNPLQTEITERKSVGFYDNPIQWFVNQTILPGQVARYNEMTRAYNDAGRRVETAQNVANRQQTIDVAAAADIYAERGVKTARMHQAVANAKAANADAEASGYIANRALQLARNAGVQIEEQRRGLEFFITLEARRERTGLKDKEAKQLEEMDKKLEVFGNNIGVPGMNVTVAKTKSAAVREGWFEGATSNVAGSDFGKAMAFINQEAKPAGMRRNGRAEAAEMVERMKDDIAAMRDKIRTDWPLANIGVRMPSEVDLYEDAGRRVGAGYANELSANMLRASPNNPYTINHAYTVRGWQGNPKNPIYEWVLAQNNKGTRITDDILWKFIQQNVDNGKIQPKVAASALAEYYNEAIARNNKVKDFQFFGLQEQDKYWVLPSGSKVRVNLMELSSIENAFTRSAIEALYEDSAEDVSLLRNYVEPAR